MTTTTESYDRPLKSIIYLVAGVFAFSLQDVIIKWFSGKYPINEIVFMRSSFSIIPIIFIAYWEGGLHVLRTTHLVGHILRSFFVFGAYTCYYLSMATLPLGVLWGYLFFKDILDFQSVIGMVMIVGSGLYIFGCKNRLTNKHVLSLFKKVESKPDG